MCQFQLFSIFPFFIQFWSFLPPSNKKSAQKHLRIFEQMSPNVSYFGMQGWLVCMYLQAIFPYIMEVYYVIFTNLHIFCLNFFP